MADGSVKIEVILDDSKVDGGVKKVEGRLGGIGGAAKRGIATVGKLAGALGLVALAGKGIDMVKQSLDGAIDRYDTLNNFPRVMEQIGFDAESSQRAIDNLSDGIQGLPTRLDEVASTAQNIAIMTGDLDSAVDTTLALNNAFLASGASTADAERGLQQYVQMLSKGKVDQQSWYTLQETMPYALRETAEAFGFTGDAATNDFYEALKNGDITMAEFNEKLIELDNAQGGFAETAQEASGGIRTAWTNMGTWVATGVADIIGAIDEAFGGVGSIEGAINGLKPVVQGVFGWIADTAIPAVADAIKWVRDRFMDLKPTFDNVKSALEPLIEVFKETQDQLQGQLSPILDNIIDLFFSLLPIIEIVAAVIGGVLITAIVIWTSIMNGAYRAIGPLINALIDLIDFIVNVVNAVIALLTGDFTGALDFWTDATDSAVSFFMNLWDGIVGFVMGIVESVIAWFEILYMTLVGNSIIPDMVNAIVEWFSNMFEWLIDIVTGIVDWIVEGFTSIYETIETIFTAARDIIIAIWGYIQETFQNALDFISALVDGDFEGMKEAMKKQMENAKELLGSIWETIKGVFGDKISDILSNVIQKFIEIKDNIQNRITEAKDALVHRFTEMVTNTIKKATEIVNNVRNKFEEVKTQITNKINEAKTQLVNKFTEMVTNTRNKATEIVTTARQKFEEVKQAIRNKLTESVTVVSQKIGEMPGKVRDKVSDMIQAGKDLVSGLISGITSMGKDAIESITGVVGGVIDKAKSLLKTKSPSLVFTEFGENVSEGLAIGIEKMKGLAEKASGKLTDSVIDGFDAELRVPALNELRGMNANSFVGEIPTSIITNYHKVERNRRDEKVLDQLKRNKQPTNITLQVDGRDLAEVQVDDITELQKRNDVRLNMWR